MGKQDAEGIENRGFAHAVDADDQVHAGLKGDFGMAKGADVGEGQVAELHGLIGNRELPGDSSGNQRSAAFLEESDSFISNTC